MSPLRAPQKKHFFGLMDRWVGGSICKLFKGLPTAINNKGENKTEELKEDIRKAFQILQLKNIKGEEQL